MLLTLFLLNPPICPISTFGLRIFASLLEPYIVISSSLTEGTFHSPWQKPSPLIYIPNSSNHMSHSFKCLFFFHYIRQIINHHLKGLPQPILPNNILHVIKTDLCSSTDARLGCHFKQSTFITFSSCSSSASMLRWDSFKQPQNYLAAVHTMSTNKEIFCGQQLAGWNHCIPQCSAMSWCLLNSHVFVLTRHCFSENVCKMWDITKDCPCHTHKQLLVEHYDTDFRNFPRFVKSSG